MTDAPHTRTPRTRRLRTVAALVVALTALTGASAVAAGREPRPREVIRNLPMAADGQVQANPMIAGGVGIGYAVGMYYSSGTGPSGGNTAAPGGTPERYIDPAQFPGGVLPPGVSITEAQGQNALARIAENLASAGLTPQDVVSMRVFLDNAPGAPIGDFAGFNRAYRQFYANTDLRTGAVLNQPVGTAPPTPPIQVNPARPSRSLLEVATLPVAGWLVEIEVVATYPERSPSRP